MCKVTEDQLKAAYDEAVEIHKNYLETEGVKLPSWGTSKAYWLAILIHCKPNYVHKDTISDIMRRYLPDAARDQQVRHLKRDGWNLESKAGSHRIEDPYKTHSGYSRELVKRQNLLLAGDFNDIKKAFANRCATCGAREGEPDPRYMEEPVKLELAHKNPAKALDKGNVIPQCQFCNRAYKDYFLFDDKGRVRAVASHEPVLRASKAVREKVMNALKKKDG